MNIEPLHQFIYDQGSDPIEWAARLIAIQFDAQESVIVARFHDPKAFPGYHLDLDSMSTARRAIAQLLDAGWTPPSLPSGEQEQGQQEPATAEETTMPNPTTTLHALAAECSAHACAWDERDDPDGHAAAWDALHTLLTAAGAWVEHLIKMRPDLAPAAAADIVTAVRQLATHLTVAEEATMTTADPTPAEIEAGMQRAAGEALERYLIGLGLDPTLIRPYAAGAAVLAAVLPDHDARVRADERAKVAEQIPGWAHEQEISGYADMWWLKCIWCNDSIKAMRDGDCLEDILTAARDHHRTCAHRLAARQHAPGATATPGRHSGAEAGAWQWQDDPDVVSWDHRQGPDLGDLRDLLARHGLSVAEVDTGTDDVAVRITRVQTARSGDRVRRRAARRGRPGDAADGGREE